MYEIMFFMCVHVAALIGFVGYCLSLVIREVAG